MRRFHRIDIRVMKRILLLLLLSISALLLIVTFPNQTHAEILTRKDARVITGVFKYIRGFQNVKDRLQVGILFDPSIPTSEKEAKKLRMEFGRMPAEQVRNLHIHLIDIADYATSSHLHIAYIPHGLQKHYADIRNISRTLHTFTLSKDASCVQENVCVVSINTEDSIEILFNEKTLRAIGLEVDAAFKFMVKRI